MSPCKRPILRIKTQQASLRINAMSSEKSTHADHPILPKVDQSTQDQGMRAILEAPFIGLAAYIFGWLIGLGEDFGSGVVVTAGLISAARFVDSGFSQKESIVSSAILGLFAQLVCYHFGLDLIIRISNALSTCYSIYLAMRNNSSTAKNTAEESHI